MITFIYRGGGGGRDTVPRNATHIVMHESVTVISANAFCKHPNIIEVYCHVGVKKVEREAFYKCPRLRRVVLLGVEVVEEMAFKDCEVLTHVDCDNIEKIDSFTFAGCTSLSSIDVQYAKVIETCAFEDCAAMTEAKFGANLESLKRWTLGNCKALERVILPLKNSLISSSCIFQGCTNLRRVDLVEAEVIDQTISALNLEEWRKDITAEVRFINRFLPNVRAGSRTEFGYTDIDEKTFVIEDWIHRVLSQITRYKAQHLQLLEEAAETLKHVVPNDVMAANVMPFLELPTHMFDGESAD